MLDGQDFKQHASILTPTCCIPRHLDYVEYQQEVHSKQNSEVNEADLIMSDGVQSNCALSSADGE